MFMLWLINFDENIIGSNLNRAYLEWYLWSIWNVVYMYCLVVFKHTTYCFPYIHLYSWQNWDTGKIFIWYLNHIDFHNIFNDYIVTRKYMKWIFVVIFLHSEAGYIRTTILFFCCGTVFLVAFDRNIVSVLMMVGVNMFGISSTRVTFDTVQLK